MISARSSQRAALLAATYLLCGCYKEEVPYDPSRHFAVERWTVRDNTTGAVLAQGCHFTSKQFAFEAEPGQLLTLEVVVEGFSVADWSKVPHEQEYWCAKKGQSPSEGVIDPDYWAETPLDGSCQLRRSVNIISTRLLPEGADPDRLLTATGYEVVLEVVRKGPFCVPCPGDAYSACTKILVQ